MPIAVTLTPPAGTYAVFDGDQTTDVEVGPGDSIVIRDAKTWSIRRVA